MSLRRRAALAGLDTFGVGVLTSAQHVAGRLC